MRTVLLIDEIEDDQEIYRSGLQALGMHVQVSGIAGAVELAAEVGPDVIILHVGDEGGWRTCDELRRTRPETPVVVLTAAVRPDAANRRRARASVNCAAFVGKPCTHEELAAVIDRVLTGERHIELTMGAIRPAAN